MSDRFNLEGGMDWVDCSIYLMFAQAHMTDWDLTENEIKVITEKAEIFVSHLAGEGMPYTDLDVSRKMKKAFDNYNKSLEGSDEDVIADVQKIAKFLKNQEWFNSTFAQSLIDMLGDISKEDGINENEIGSIKSLAEYWDVNPPKWAKSDETISKGASKSKSKTTDTGEAQTEENLTLQGQLAERFTSIYSAAVVKKIDDGNYLDIHLPNIHNRKGTHIWFNTPKSGGIKIGFYCRDKEFVETAVDASSDTIETYSSGLRPKGAPVFDNIDDAIEAVQSFIGDLSRKLN